MTDRKPKRDPHSYARKRQRLELTLSPEAHRLLSSLSEAWKCSRSKAVERMLRGLGSTI